MVWFLWAVTALSLLAGVALGLYRWMRRNSERIVEDLRQAHGPDLLHVSGCGVVSGESRVPGVLALVGDRIVYRPVTFVEAGEIPLRRVVVFHSEDTRATRYGRARKYIGAHVLAFRTDTGEQRVFVIRKARARGWEEALGKAGLRPRSF